MYSAYLYRHMSDEERGHSPTDSASSSSAAESPAATERAPNTLLNAFIGGIAGVMLSFIPFSTVLGGGIAGYLEGGDVRSGAKVGALAGLVALVPFAFIFGIVLVFVPVTSGTRFQLALWVSVLLILVFAAVYAIGLSTLGGVLGVYVKEEV